ncbi:unnamed protein product [Owenia fusiformis]|uniref:Peptidase S1 domain-containing protein n=1 Tax=Owenia fusiformis TaxID=6347 RepID=A0A8S4N8J9_OWEFU|nr:unnamed protein product [Owenia fusiformis]
MAGGHNRGCSTCTRREQAHTVQDVIIHPGFEANINKGHPNDIALLELATNVVLDNITARVIELPPESNTFAGQSCTIVGWGMTRPGIYADELRKTSLPVLTGEQCLLYWPQANQTTHICVYDTSDRISACNGDEGSPMMCQHNGQTVLAGVSSFVVNGCLYKPSVYTRVSEYKTWICEETDGALAYCNRP